ncbi:NAD(P)H-hydrate dehydratase [Desulfobotulus sp. H1]|uniref:Bifunctional NAD(P)H-hydrate repair enzyme n=1 Tax=Desulfobotulus pelophilus TaxID=2823377 RepID=A0ABT3N4U5_9BACT|nr:NAD(P)H-hydrate dehydratase [Desulfobotulus pelophilus]MCW7752482.1 NAD(P)H-hydrate dehydratase [Desulfobotulus pelophilus]
MARIVTASTMAAMDRATMDEFGLPGRILMETAGREAARIIRQHYPLRDTPILILCGNGNNGGDGWVTARYLLGWGAQVSVLLAGSPEKLTQNSLINRSLYEKAGGCVLTADNDSRLAGHRGALQRAALFVDALFGIGLDRDVKGHFATLTDTVRESGKSLISLDIPSGIHADTGHVLGTAFRSDHTITFGFAKPGHFLEPGRSHRGILHTVDIGIPEVIYGKIPSDLACTDPEWAKEILTMRSPESHKGNFGHILLVAGAPDTRGAAVLAATGALRSGAGLLSLMVPEASLPLPGIPPEVMLHTVGGNNRTGFDDTALQSVADLLEGKTLVAAGPGMGTSSSAARILQRLLDCPLPLVLDADALNLLALHPELMEKCCRRPHTTVLTPHPGEMARLCQTSSTAIQQDRIAAAVCLATDSGCHILLKGASTVAATPEGFCRIVTSGNPGMATGGSGDVLCGILAGLMAQGLPADEAVPLAAYVHGLAGDHLAKNKGPIGYLPSEVAHTIPRIIQTTCIPPNRENPGHE